MSVVITIPNMQATIRESAFASGEVSMVFSDGREITITRTRDDSITVNGWLNESSCQTITVPPVEAK